MNQEETFDIIDAYLWDTLSPQEKADFQNKLAEDTELANEVAIRKIEHEAMRLILQKDLRSKMKSWDEEEARHGVFEPTPLKAVKSEAKIFSLKTLRWAAAASLIGIAFAFFWGNQNFNDDAILKNLNAGSTLRGTENLPSILPQNILQALDKAEKGNAKDAITELEGLQSDPNYADLIQMQLANLYSKNDDIAKAKTLYQTIILRNSNSAIVMDAEWQLLNILFKEDNKSIEFKTLLSKIADDKNHRYYDNALAVQKQLGHFMRRFYEGS